MDGIFGVGVAEVLVIVLVIFIIGGPKNTIKWSREMGRMISKLRGMWQQMMSELEKEVGDEGREIMDATRDLTRNVNEIRHTANPTRLARETKRLIDETVREADEAVKADLAETEQAIRNATQKPKNTPPTQESEQESTPSNGRYQAWTKDE